MVVCTLKNYNKNIHLISSFSYIVRQYHIFRFSAYSCPTCQRSFRNDTTLVSHILTHVRKSNFVCHFCDKAFYSVNAVKIHLKRHIRKRPVLAAEASPFYDEEEEKRKSKICMENEHGEIKTTSNKQHSSMNAENERFVSHFFMFEQRTLFSLFLQRQILYLFHRPKNEKKVKCSQCVLQLILCRYTNLVTIFT